MHGTTMKILQLLRFSFQYTYICKFPSDLLKWYRQAYLYRLCWTDDVNGKYIVVIRSDTSRTVTPNVYWPPYGIHVLKLICLICQWQYIFLKKLT